MKPTAITGVVLALTLAQIATGPGLPARGQESALERFKALTEPEEEKEKQDKEKTRPPLELPQVRVSPFDVLPFVKPHHWSTFSAEARANHFPYEGRLSTMPIRLHTVQEVIYQRDVHLPKGELRRFPLQVLLPRIPREIGIALGQAGSIRVDDEWPVRLQSIEPHQMLIVVLARDPSAFALWNGFLALSPPPRWDEGVLESERRRYYRLVIPLNPKKPALSPQPLTWTPISQILWDSLTPESLSLGQQQALLDWLHWGGQLVVNGGAGPWLAPLQDSFLGPYLPVEGSQGPATLTEADLAALSAAYPPPFRPSEPENPETNLLIFQGIERDPGRVIRPRYAPPAPIRPAPDQPIYLEQLTPKPGATELRLGPGSDRVLGIEWRVGRGRVTVLGVGLTDPALAAWPGLDTLVRRVVLRRPEEPRPEPGRSRLAGPDLSWLRLLGRDLGAGPAPPPPQVEGEEEPELLELPQELNSSETPVAAWLDNAALPVQCREALLDASGIKIPGSAFVLKVLLAYLVALVPLNWLLCRYVLRRREWAWALVPVLALGFAVAVERAASYDLGFDSACDEIDLLELQPGYRRAHLNRFATLYSTGRVRYTLSYPGDPTALALPMETGPVLRSEQVSGTTWQSLPVPALIGLQVQPRSLSLFRAEQVASVGGTITLADEGDSVVNATGLELRDAVVVGPRGDPTPLGTIPPGGSVPLTGPVPSPSPSPSPVDDSSRGGDWIDPEGLLALLRDYHWPRPEDRGEVRLVAWSPGAWTGQQIDPAVNRHRGLTLIVAHLKYGPPPAPDDPTYDRSDNPSTRSTVP